MIDIIKSTCPHIFIGAFQTSKPWFSMQAPFAGSLRYNSETMFFEFFNGNMWTRLDNPYFEVSLSPETRETLDWAKEKMNYERKIAKLAETNQTVKAAYENLRKAEDQLKVVTILSTP